MLTDRFIRNAKTGVYADEGGLYLQVYASGNKAFIWRSQRSGQTFKKVLGHYPAMGLAEARQALEDAKNGRASISVREAFDAYFEHVAPRHRKPDLLRRLFDKDILPTIQDRALDSVTRAEYTAIFKVAVRRGAPTIGNAALTNTKTFLNYCVAMGWLDTNPLLHTPKDAIGGPPVARDRTLSWEEIRSFLRWLMTCHTVDAGNRVGLYLCLLTGLRASEVLSFHMTDKPYLEGDAKRTRAGPVRYKVPLTPEIRAAMRLFTSRPASHGSMSQVLRRHGFSFTPHDLRRTFASRLADFGVHPHVIEKLLNHKMTGIMAVYNRSEYWEDRVAAMKLWCAEVRKNRRGAKLDPA